MADPLIPRVLGQDEIVGNTKAPQYIGNRLCVVCRLAVLSRYNKFDTCSACRDTEQKRVFKRLDRLGGNSLEGINYHAEFGTRQALRQASDPMFADTRKSQQSPQP
jgi:hypothetical protein